MVALQTTQFKTILGRVKLQIGDSWGKHLCVDIYAR